MSKRKKSIGKVKPPWFGKTPTSLLKLVEELLVSPHKSVQRRQSDNSKRQLTVKDYIGRRKNTRREDRAAAKAHPVDSWVRGNYGGSTFTGKITRIRSGSYTVQNLNGQVRRVPYWVEMSTLLGPGDWARLDDYWGTT
jgi:hypothetical protein